MKDLLDYLGEAEGTHLHYNSTEKDITTPYGIYRVSHPDAEVFTYIDKVAKSIGITKPSSKWNSVEVKKVDNAIDRGKLNELIYKFYEDFLVKIHLNTFDEEAKLAAFSMYVNSPKLMWKSVQSTINKFVTNKWIDYKIQTVDGGYGNDTKNGLFKVNEACDSNPLFGVIFEAYMVSHMQLEYAKLVADNPDKYLKYLIGWNNRVTKFLEKSLINLV